VEQFERIRRDQREEGLSVRALARRHGVHRRTVRQASRRRCRRGVHADSAGDRRLGHSSGHGSSRIGRRASSTARRIWQRLIDEHGAVVAESTVREVVRELRAELGGGVSSVTIVACHAPGEEAEVDFGEATIVLAGEPTKVHLFHLRLSASGKAVTAGFLAPDQTAFLEGHAIAFARLGGVPGRIRYDNLTSAVK
jgi:transposase